MTRSNSAMSRSVFSRAALVLTLLSSVFAAMFGDLASARQESPYLDGELLVAAPDMPDPRFAETVIYMVRHNQAGAMGLIVNRPMAKGPLVDLLKALGIKDEPASGETVIHYGGPVEPAKFFVVHSDDYVANSTTRASQGVAVTGSDEVIRAIARGNGPRQSLLLLGYAGWAPGQVEAEIKQGGWFSIPADKSLIFDGDPETMWKRALDRRKIKT
ncbi:MAG: YqgE/AlgH family protein [Candidatus Binatia bacterium]